MFRTVSLPVRLWCTPDDLAASRRGACGEGEEEGGKGGGGENGKLLLSASFNGENPTFTVAGRGSKLTSTTYRDFLLTWTLS